MHIHVGLCITDSNNPIEGHDLFCAKRFRSASWHDLRCGPYDVRCTKEMTRNVIVHFQITRETNNDSATGFEHMLHRTCVLIQHELTVYTLYLRLPDVPHSFWHDDERPSGSQRASGLQQPADRGMASEISPGSQLWKQCRTRPVPELPCQEIVRVF